MYPIYQIHRKTNKQKVRQKEVTEEYVPKEQDETSTEPSEVEMGNLPDEKFKVMIIKMFNKFKRRIGEHSDYNKVL